MIETKTTTSAVSRLTTLCQQRGWKFEFRVDSVGPEVDPDIEVFVVVKTREGERRSDGFIGTFDRETAREKAALSLLTKLAELRLT